MKLAFWMLRRVLAVAAVAGAAAVVLMAICVGFFLPEGVDYDQAVAVMYAEIAVAVCCGIVSGFIYRAELK